MIVVALTATMAEAKPPLRDVKSIDDAVFDIAVADQIRKKCPDIAPRLIQAYSLYRATRAQAKALGYTDAEIEAYGDSDVEKARMRARGDVFFKANGVVASDPQTFCALGRAEIEKSSRIGSLLRTK
jgi:hypothetical protein